MILRIWWERNLQASSGAESGGGIGWIRTTASSTELSRPYFHSTSALPLTSV
eukprot:CAMPEP_0181179200 /NCGR_PEP_ID=MMETSP1096-20121128/6132_1 /TAXON_ID=156174 ORGANISM="Chrysochromulina ericina, Strain CCMP281" /NCGR_SAMPLE_ID=MMETSP1096 /ASSEMBLY_ACC=CAM_ASM_000453 /LENGTH=51 /DNA_ID=CAMNT_0023267531 /DNA_START=616 /DNA_END=771 /DNA_ORIENTATION=+